MCSVFIATGSASAAVRWSVWPVYGAPAIAALNLRSAAECRFWTHGRVFAQVSVSGTGSGRRNSDGTPVRYLQLAHNEWDAATKTSRPRVLYSFGREDALDRAVIERLVASLCRLLDPGAALAARTATGLQFVSSRAFGGVWLLDQMWRRLGIDAVMTRLLAGPRGVVEAGRRGLDLPAGAHRGPARHDR